MSSGPESFKFNNTPPPRFETDIDAPEAYEMSTEDSVLQDSIVLEGTEHEVLPPLEAPKSIATSETNEGLVIEGEYRVIEQYQKPTSQEDDVSETTSSARPVSGGSIGGAAHFNLATTESLCSLCGKSGHAEENCPNILLHAGSVSTHPSEAAQARLESAEQNNESVTALTEMNVEEEVPKITYRSEGGLLPPPPSA
jgi:hypothetical protein